MYIYISTHLHQLVYFLNGVFKSLLGSPLQFVLHIHIMELHGLFVSREFKFLHHRALLRLLASHKGVLEILVKLFEIGNVA